MIAHENLIELENIKYKYERLTSMIGILQTFVAECVDVSGTSTNALPNALLEIELEMKGNNEAFDKIIVTRGA